jgi:predicted nucleic acid-binding protein
MVKQYRIYMDVCCFNRPFDSWQQERVRFEGEAVLSILKQVRGKEWQLISSEAIEAELERLSNPEKLASIWQLLNLATTTVMLDQQIDLRSQVLENLGFGLYDSFHIACAEASQVDILLTTDDRLLKRAKRYNDIIQVQLNNPVNWLMDILLTEGDQNHDTD